MCKIKSAGEYEIIFQRFHPAKFKVCRMKIRERLASSYYQVLIVWWNNFARCGQKWKHDKPCKWCSKSKG